MFENEIAINQLQLKQFAAVMADLPEDSLFTRGNGHGHPPVWILGHLAIVGEMGQTFLGGSLTHPRWVPLFGPGSSDEVKPHASLTRDALITDLNQAYETLRSMAAEAKPEDVAGPHGIALFDGSPIQTVGHAVSLLLTNHFAFHLSQLSGCRRDRGLGHIF
ncbi:DinB family protein [uncultured Gimesia sp.]|jgi:hypothetical protein|uniref:DinB family protein n=1 Tax=uncultured Gimesia sp. TaxID=1678688 RepID=UPI00263386F2|nr:DinB family protein [uncultured Gimesia sp.]